MTRLKAIFWLDYTKDMYQKLKQPIRIAIKIEFDSPINKGKTYVLLLATEKRSISFFLCLLLLSFGQIAIVSDLSVSFEAVACSFQLMPCLFVFYGLVSSRYTWKCDEWVQMVALAVPILMFDD